MSRNEEIDRFLGQVTAGLKEDPGLCREVSSELAAHLEDAAAQFREAGIPEEECVQQALKTFGSPVDVAGDLKSANLKRMQWRSRARLLVRMALIPLAILVTLVHMRTVLSSSQQSVSIIENLDGTSSSVQNLFTEIIGFVTGSPQIESTFTSEQLFLIQGDTSRPTKPEQIRAIWERFPDETVYFGNYITQLLAHYDPGRSNLAHYEQELRLGMELDPQNARYPFLLASLHFDQAAELKSHKEEGRTDTYELIVHDRTLLDLAMQEFLEGAKKPHRTCYGEEMLTRQRQMFPTATSINEQIYQVGLATGIILPDITHFMKLMRAVPSYAETLSNENQKEKALQVLDAWFPYLPMQLEASWTLIDTLVLAAMAGLGESVSLLYEDLGYPDRAQHVLTQTRALTKPVEDWKARTNNADATKLDEALRRHASVLASFLIPALGPDTFQVEDLNEGRQLEYVFAERSALLGLETLFLLIMLALGIIALRWRFFAGGDAIPLLLLPSVTVILRVLLLGAVLPMVLYVLYTRWSLLGVRDFSILYLWPRPILELGLLVLTVLILVAALTAHFVRKKCVHLDVPVPAQGKPWRRRVPCCLLALGWLTLLSTNFFLESDTLRSNSVVITGIVLGLLVLGLIGTFARAILQHSYGLFHGTLARAMIPVFAITLLLLGPLGHQYLKWEEAKWVRADRFLDLDDTPGFTVPESELTERLRSEMKAGLASVPDL